ncbi:hypothetical protein EHP00_1841 [Ecytonucleospora hepatopenaei]|uniref:Uncharacterized protein n=1 Tax=Ecytonucleospora hepatopenaei TaxID=646526 RepID=A0A1W0E2P6_9MICR|nr:hypothetical protein EHP00_1841 [Ecytonucleospora hepatopenaei]
MFYCKFLNFLYFSNVIYNAIIIKKENDFNLTNSHLHNTVEKEINNTTETLLDNINDNEYLKDMEELFKNYNKEGFLDSITYNLFSKVWSGPKHHEYNMIIKNILINLEKPGFTNFTLGSRALSSTIYFFLKKVLLPFYNLKMNSNLNINDFFHKSTITSFCKTTRLKMTFLDYRKLYFNVFLNSITNLILAAHKYHKFMIANYKDFNEKLKFKMIVTDMYMHVSVAHIIQGFTIIDEFQNLLNMYEDNVKSIFSIDFKLYNKMIRFKKYFIQLENFCILGEMNFIQNNVTDIITNNELEKKYKDWDEINKLKNKYILRVKRKQFCDKYKLKHIDCINYEIKKFMKDVNDVYKNNLKNITKNNDDNKIFLKEESNNDITNVDENISIKQEVDIDIVKEELDY